MARQIQLRRGTADQHETFTGAEGEVTFDITNKTLRAHDGSTPGSIALARKDDVPNMDTADYVIASQEPTAANGLTWYRKYKSGWVEQGGHIFGSSSVTFPIPMKNNDYVWRINSLYNHSGFAPYSELGELETKNPTGFTKAGNAKTFIWEVRGIAA